MPVVQEQLIQIFRANGIINLRQAYGRQAGWRRGSKLPGKPDFIFLRLKTAVFVDGCFNLRRAYVFVVRAFVRMRELLLGSLAEELKKLEAKLTDRLDVHEIAITDVLRRIMLLLDPPSVSFASVSRRMARENRGQTPGWQQPATVHPNQRNQWASTRR